MCVPAIAQSFSFVHEIMEGMFHRWPIPFIADTLRSIERDGDILARRAERKAIQSDQAVAQHLRRLGPSWFRRSWRFVVDAECRLKEFEAARISVHVVDDELDTDGLAAEQRDARTAMLDHGAVASHEEIFRAGIVSHMGESGDGRNAVPEFAGLMRRPRDTVEFYLVGKRCPVPDDVGFIAVEVGIRHEDEPPAIGERLRFPWKQEPCIDAGRAPFGNRIVPPQSRGPPEIGIAPQKLPGPAIGRKAPEVIVPAEFDAFAECEVLHLPDRLSLRRATPDAPKVDLVLFSVDWAILQTCQVKTIADEYLPVRKHTV